MNMTPDDAITLCGTVAEPERNDSRAESLPEPAPSKLERRGRPSLADEVALDASLVAHGLGAARDALVAGDIATALDQIHCALRNQFEVIDRLRARRARKSG
jgi:hypothetical protein